MQSWTWVVAQQRTVIPYGTEVPLKGTQDRQVENEESNWISGDLRDEDEEEEEPGFRVRSGLTDVTNLDVVSVVGPQQGGSVVELGQPVAVRRKPTPEEKRSWELLQEAIKEGERGLKKHVAWRREARVLQQQRQDQGF